MVDELKAWALEKFKHHYKNMMDTSRSSNNYLNGTDVGRYNFSVELLQKLGYSNEEIIQMKNEIGL